MNRTLLALALRSALSRKGSTVLTVASVTLAAFLLVGFALLGSSIRQAFAGSVGSVDLIVGPPAGELELLLATVFGIGTPAGTVPAAVWEPLEAHDDVEWAIPWSLGDSYRGWRVVGTTEALLEAPLDREGEPLVLATGRIFSQPLEVVAGSAAARELHLELGRRIAVSHGMGASPFDHDDHPFTVVGILAPSRTAFDRALYVPLEGLARIHQFADEAPPTAHDVSAVLLGTTSKVAVLGLREQLRHADSPLTAILPGLALAELWRIFGSVETLIRITSLLVAVVAALSIAVALLAAVAERQRELAVLRAIGLGPAGLSILLASEALLVSLAGTVGGALLAPAGLRLAAPWLERRFGTPLDVAAPDSHVWWSLAGLVCLSLLVVLPVVLVTVRRSLGAALIPRP